jgi:hypothetical protein
VTGVVARGGCRWVVVAGAVLAGCGGRTDAPPAAPPLRVMSAAALRAVPMTASLDLPVQASVYAWRDFMPTIGDSARVHDLMVSVQVRGGVVPPKVLDCDGIHVVMADSVFAARPAEQRAGDGPGAVECLLRGGPEWHVGAAIQVVISVGSGAQRTLIRRETTIDATS